MTPDPDKVVDLAPSEWKRQGEEPSPEPFFGLRGDELVVALLSNRTWLFLQSTVFSMFCLANIYYDWDIEPMVAGVMGSMGAWYVTRIVVYHLDRRRLAQDRHGSAPDW